MPLIFNTTVNRKEIEVGCYGEGTHWLCRLTDLALQPSPRGACDAYYPSPELGFLWLREHVGMCLVSGMVHDALFGGWETLYDLVKFIMRQLHWDSLPSTCIQIVSVGRTFTFDGERGEQVF